MAVFCHRRRSRSYQSERHKEKRGGCSSIRARAAGRSCPKRKGRRNEEELPESLPDFSSFLGGYRIFLNRGKHLGRDGEEKEEDLRGAAASGETLPNPRYAKGEDQPSLGGESERRPKTERKKNSPGNVDTFLVPQRVRKYLREKKEKGGKRLRWMEEAGPHCSARYVQYIIHMH